MENKKNNLRKRLCNSLGVAGLAGAYLLSGCGTTSEALSKKNYENEGWYERTERAKKVLGYDSQAYIRDMQGYRCSMSSEATLQTIAGIYAGTVDVVKTDKGYLFNGSYSEYQNPEAMKKVLEEADVNKDWIITRDEARSLLSKILK